MPISPLALLSKVPGGDLVKTSAEAVTILAVLQQDWIGGPLAFLRAELTGLINEVPFATFSLRWRWLRQMIGLQARLLIEQALWVMGDPWRSLITGFEPIGALPLEFDEAAVALALAGVPPATGGGSGGSGGAIVQTVSPPKGTRRLPPEEQTPSTTLTTAKRPYWWR